MRRNEDRIILAVAGLLLLIITLASGIKRFRPQHEEPEGEVFSSDHGGTAQSQVNTPTDWEDRHAFYHLRGVPHGHPTDKEEEARAEGAWAEELQRRQAASGNR